MFWICLRKYFEDGQYFHLYKIIRSFLLKDNDLGVVEWCNRYWIWNTFMSIDETTIKNAGSILYYIQHTCETFSNDDSVVLFSINSDSNSFFVGKRWWNVFKCFDTMESIKYLGQYMINSTISKSCSFWLIFMFYDE